MLILYVYSFCVALRKESVDRNPVHPAYTLYFSVALRKESVDRNIDILFVWAEFYVALRKESVDRNWSAYPRKTGKAGRSPQGERG